MAVDRLSVTVPSDMGAALRSLAEARGETVSTVVAEAVAHRLRIAALDSALAEADRRFGPVPDALQAQAETELAGAMQRRPARRRKRRGT